MIHQGDLSLLAKSMARILRDHFTAGMLKLEELVRQIPPGKDGRDGRDGKDGRDGQDALDLTILDSIDEQRVYPRGTFAYFKGGLVRFDGQQWKCVVRGIDRETDEISEDARTRTIKTVYTDGTVRASVLRTPVLIYREIFKEGTDYQPGDVVTWNNSAWHCQKETTAIPGTTTDWRLMVRRGGDGKTGPAGPEGKAGKDGRDGRDLTQMGFDGSKH